MTLWQMLGLGTAIFLGFMLAAAGAWAGVQLGTHLFGPCRKTVIVKSWEERHDV